MAAQQQQVDQHLHRLGAAAVLGQAHPVDADRRLCPRIDGGGGLQRLALEAGFRLDCRPVQAVAEAFEFLEAVSVLGDEGHVEHARTPLRLRRPVGGKQRLADAGNRRDVAARLHLMVLGRDLRRGFGEHLDRRLRVGEALQAAFPQRVEGDDRHAPAAGVLQRMQHPRRIRADVLAEEQDQIGRLEILQHRRPDRHADRLRQRLGGRFVAHVGGVGQVVGAVDPRVQRVHVARFQRGPARGVEHHRVRIEPLQFAADLGERLLPGDRNVAVALWVVA